MYHLLQAMKVYGHAISDEKALTNFDLNYYVRKLGIEKFRGVFIPDTLPKECEILNLNKSHQAGIHWGCYYKDGKTRIYVDSFGQIIPMEIQRYLKTKEE